MVRGLICFGAVAVGISQVFFQLILDAPDRFPRPGNFHLWTLGWTLLVPGLGVLGFDLLMERAGSRPARIWRAVLLGAVVLSILRHVQVWRPVLFVDFLWGSPPAVLAAAIVLLMAGIALKRPKEARLCLLALGIAGTLLTARYVARTGVWGPAWASETLGARVSGDPSARPVFILVFDELAYEVLQDGDRVRETEFPSFAALARDGAFFTRATTNHFECGRSVATLLTGQLRPEPGRASVLDRLAERREVILFDTFRHADRWAPRQGATRRVYSRGKAQYLSLGPGYALRYLTCAFAESPFAATPLNERRAWVFPPVNYWERPSTREWARLEMELVLRWIREDASAGRATYWHCPLPHGPFVYTRDGVEHGRKDTLFTSSRTHGRETLENYREQAGFADAILGRVVARLKAEGLYDQATLVVTSDHGLRTWFGEFEPAGFPGVRSGLAPRVPLIIKSPGLEPGPRSTDYQHMDFAPTLLRLLDIPFDPAAFNGRPAFEAHDPRQKVFIDRDQLPRVLDLASGLWELPK